MKQLPLSRGLVALVDDDVFEELNKHKWNVHDFGKLKYYAGARIRGEYVRLHNFIMNPPTGLEVDHINGETLDCRRVNMRLTDHATNCRNRIKPDAGVSYDSWSGKWRARIGFNYERIDLGKYTNKEEAVAIVQRARLILNAGGTLEELEVAA